MGGGVGGGAAPVARGALQAGSAKRLGAEKGLLAPRPPGRARQVHHALLPVRAAAPAAVRGQAGGRGRVGPGSLERGRRPAQGEIALLSGKRSWWKRGRGEQGGAEEQRFGEDRNGKGGREEARQGGGGGGRVLAENDWFI